MSQRVSDRFRVGLELAVKDMYAIAAEVEEILRLGVDGFERFRADAPQQAIAREGKLRKDCERLVEVLIALSEGRADEEKTVVQAHLGMLNHLEMIGSCGKDFAERVVVKVKEGLLFSDKAFKEIKDLYFEVGSLLRNSILATRNKDTALAHKVIENGRAVERLIDSFGTEHEKRLISGVCAIKSSALFLDMLDAMRRISGHAISICRSLKP